MSFNYKNFKRPGVAGTVLQTHSSLIYSFNNKLSKKRSRARVTIGGQCVLLQNSLKIKLFDFFLKAKITV